MNSIAIIPARGGSKRIPNKNIKPFLGQPIIGHVINKLLASGQISEVYVSTDSEQIAEVAKSFGAKVPFMRPPELSDDFTSTNEVIKHAICNIDQEISTENVFCVYPTSVGILDDDIQLALDIFQNKSWEYVFTAVESTASPLRAFMRNMNGGSEMLFPEYWDFRSQDLPEVYTDAALFYLANKETWHAEQPIFSPKSTFISIPEERAVDINTEKDWLKSEMYLRELLKSKN